VTDLAHRPEAAGDRRAWILSTLRTVGFLSVADLARELGVSQMTIRRDLHSMRGSGHVRLVHGGASLAPSALRSAAFSDDEHAEARGRVAAHAVGLVGRTDTIAIDAGATGHAIARALPEDFAGCVITHSMPVLQYLTEDGPGRVVALGGEPLPGRRAFGGPATEAAVAQLRVRTFFVSPAAVDSRGLYAQSPAEASLQRRLMDVADEIVVVSTRETFETSAPALVGSLQRVTALVCDRRPPPELACALRQVGVVPRVVGS
jgi:DeoR/GlpR family transcriptional regulator of sugar metabolism